MAKPQEIKLHTQSRQLEIHFDDGFRCSLPCEYLRVFSPSAEVRGHGPAQAVLQIGKEHVAITAIEPAGNYAIQLHYDDGHNSGIYTWNYLYELGVNQQANWQDYLQRLAQAGVQRRVDN